MNKDKAIDKLLNNPGVTKAIAGAWPAIKEILNEQMLITAANSENNDDQGKVLKGLSTSYRCLEKFKDAGEKFEKEST